MVETPLRHCLLSPALHPLSPHLGLLSLSLQILAQSQNVLLSLCPHLKSTGSPIPSSPSGAGVAVHGWNSVALSGCSWFVLRSLFGANPEKHCQSSSSQSDEDSGSSFCVVSVCFSLCFSHLFSFQTCVTQWAGSHRGAAGSNEALWCDPGHPLVLLHKLKHSGATLAIHWFCFMNWAFWVLSF